MTRALSLCFALLLCASGTLHAQVTVGLIKYSPAASEGYVLFAPIGSTHTYLIDRCGREVHSWISSYTPGLGAKLGPDGTLYRSALIPSVAFNLAGGLGGRIERYDWNGNLIWGYNISNDSLCQHHDFTVLPNGNVIVIAWERHDSANAVLHGRDPAATNAWVWSERLIELQPVGTDSAVVVWQWRLWDHVVQHFAQGLPNYAVVSDHPELMDINQVHGPPPQYDWIHMNSVSYNADRNELILSSHTQNEVWIIDHSTTTAEAASHMGGVRGHGGDLLYRWGNPSTYGRGTNADKRLFGQHDATWIPAGHANAGDVLVFNNGLNRPDGPYSSVEVIQPPIDPQGNYAIGAGLAYGPTDAAQTITANHPTDLFSQNIGGVVPTESGYLVTDGVHGMFLQFNVNDSIIWEYRNPVSPTGPLVQGSPPESDPVFRCLYYPPDFPGFIGRDLDPGQVIELGGNTSICAGLTVDEVADRNLQVFPDPASGPIHVRMAQQFSGRVEATVMNMEGGQVLDRVVRTTEFDLDLSHLPAGTYILRLKDDQGHLAYGKLVRIP